MGTLDNKASDSSWRTRVSAFTKTGSTTRRFSRGKSTELSKGEDSQTTFKQGGGTSAQGSGSSGVFGQGSHSSGSSGTFAQGPGSSGTFGQGPRYTGSSGTFGQGPRYTGSSGTFAQGPGSSGTFGQGPHSSGSSGVFGQGPQYTGSGGTFGQGPGSSGVFGQGPHYTGSSGTIKLDEETIQAEKKEPSIRVARLVLTSKFVSAGVVPPVMSVFRELSTESAERSSPRRMLEPGGFVAKASPSIRERAKVFGKGDSGILLPYNNTTPVFEGRQQNRGSSAILEIKSLNGSREFFGDDIPAPSPPGSGVLKFIPPPPSPQFSNRSIDTPPPPSPYVAAVAATATSPTHPRINTPPPPSPSVKAAAASPAHLRPLAPLTGASLILDDDFDEKEFGSLEEAFSKNSASPAGLHRGTNLRSFYSKSTIRSDSIVARLNAADADLLKARGWDYPSGMPSNNPFVLRSLIRNAPAPWKGRILNLTSTFQMSSIMDNVYCSSNSVRSGSLMRDHLGHVTVCGVPRSGQTPILQIVASLRAGYPEQVHNLPDEASWPEAVYGAGVSKQASLHKTQIYKTHMSLRWALGSSINNVQRVPDSHRVIVTLREPLDLRLSWFRHVRRTYIKTGGTSGSVDSLSATGEFDAKINMDEFARMSRAAFTISSAQAIDNDYENFVDEVFETMESFYTARSHVLIVFYEELLQNPGSVVKKIADFLGNGGLITEEPCSEELIDQITRAVENSEEHPKNHKRIGSSDQGHTHFLPSAVAMTDSKWDDIVHYGTYEALYVKWTENSYPFEKLMPREAPKISNLRKMSTLTSGLLGVGGNGSFRSGEDLNRRSGRMPRAASARRSTLKQDDLLFGQGPPRVTDPDTAGGHMTF